MADLPKKGDRFKCPKCGMAIEVTDDCKCATEDPNCDVCFQCCGDEMLKVAVGQASTKVDSQVK